MWITAIILGLAGSLHCAGMCAPLVIAVTNLRSPALLNRVIYNAGRVLTYSLLGASVAAFSAFLPIADYQNLVSILLGITLLVIGIGGIKNVRIPIITNAAQKLTAWIKVHVGLRLNHKSKGTTFILGAINGILPCGLTAIALTWCLTLKGPIDGFNFMLFFGIGTLPVMLGLAGVIPLLVKRLNWSINRLTTSMLIISGLAMIARVFILHVPHNSDAGIVEIILCR